MYCIFSHVFGIKRTNSSSLSFCWIGRTYRSTEVRNSAITELQARGGPPSLTMFNALPHLRARAEITLR